MFQNETAPRPLYSALFLLPFLGMFELGTIIYSHGSISPVFSQIFFPGMFSLFFLSVLAIQHYCYAPVQNTYSPHPAGQIYRLTDQWMQSWLLGLPPALLVLAICFIVPLFYSDSMAEFRLVDHALQSLKYTDADYDQSGILRIGHIIYLSLSAGLVEEFLFRVLLLSGLFGLLLGLKVPRSSSLYLSIILSSGLFALAHDTSLIENLSQLNFDTFTSQSLGLLMYRLCAGIYLALIYLHRGLGIATGTHIVYDLTLGCSI